MEGECMQKRKYCETRQHSPEGTATQFVASPKSITKEKALQMKKSDRRHVQIRYISTEAISEIDASRESPPGYEVCVSPHFSGTNKYFEELMAKQERFDRVELYIAALYSSISLCVADLIMVPMFMLDYHMRRIFLQKKKEASDPKRYQGYFVGKGKNKPFKGTFGDQISYCYLLKCYLKLAVMTEDEDDTDIEEKDTTFSKEQLEKFQDLLESSEGYLSAALSYCAATNMKPVEIRQEAQMYFESQEKGFRDTRAHLFTQLFYQQKRTPIEKQHLHDTIFPPENDAFFQLKDPGVLLSMGLKILALADIEKRLNASEVSPFHLKSAAPTLVRAGIDLIRRFILLKGNVNEAVEFRYGSLTATMGEKQPTKSIDLLASGH